MKITGSVSIDVDKRVEAQIFNAFLHKLTDELWLVEKATTDNKKGIYRTIDMQGHGSDVDELVTENIDDPRYAVQVAAYRLHRLLMEADNKRRQPKRIVQDGLQEVIWSLSRNFGIQREDKQQQMDSIITKLKTILDVDRNRKDLDR
jgi:hydroxylamine reductase (hybrid-cluster protein)